MTLPLEVRVAPETWVPIATLHEAAVAVCQHVDAYGITVETWGQDGAPVRRAATEEVVAFVSRDGRVWEVVAERREVTGPALFGEGTRR